MKAKDQKAKAKQVTHCEQPPEGVLLFTKEQMAALLQVSVRCLGEMMRRGEISYLKIGGKMVRFRAALALRRLRETSLVCHGEGAVASEQSSVISGQWPVSSGGRDKQGQRSEARGQGSGAVRREA